MSDDLYIAVDLGAGSGRVFLCGFGEDLSLSEIHRFEYPPRFADGHLRWDFRLILNEILAGLKKAAREAKTRGRRIYSVGVDSWAVDYGLLDADGGLLGDPVCYRDSRTDDAPARVFEKVPRETVFERSGIQFLNFNTLFQLASEDETLTRAASLLLLPDLINFFLTGTKHAEFSNATTTQFLNAETRNWDVELLDNLGIPASILPPITEAGTDLGRLTADIAAQTGLEDVRVIAPATHDTASAVIGAPIAESVAYISSGTWSLVGIETDTPLINAEVAAENFTNEGGAYGTIRFLKNVMGLWIFESCRREWKAAGLDVGYAELLEQVSEVRDFRGFIFPDDPRFLNPRSMVAAINEQLNGRQNPVSDPVVVTKIILDSLAFRYASVLRTIERLTKRRLIGLQIVGGGGRNEYLNQMTADATGLPVSAGPVEATVTGNAIVQAISAGRFDDVRAARRFVMDNIETKRYFPRATPDVRSGFEEYLRIESEFK